MTTRAPSKCLAYRGSDAEHEFDPVSGWCLYGCGLRQDGRHHTPGGSVIDPGPADYPETRRKQTLTTQTKETEHAEPLF